MNQIYVTGLFEMPRFVEELEPSHLVSIIQPEFQPDRPVLVPVENHLRVAVHDISEADGWGVLVGQDDVRSLINFLESWNPDTGSLMVHCFAGVSRSTASALIAHYLKSGDAEASAQELRHAAPHAAPNRRIVELADQELGLRGLLMDAVANIGPPTAWLERETLATLSLD